VRRLIGYFALREGRSGRRREEWDSRRVNREGVVEVILILDFELLGFHLLE